MKDIFSYRNCLIGFIILTTLLACLAISLTYIGLSTTSLILEKWGTFNQSKETAISEESSFFQSKGGFDSRRIALLAPYEAISINGKTWDIQLQLNSIAYQDWITDISHLDVIDCQFIVSVSHNSFFSGNRVEEVWFFISPNENIELGFEDQNQIKEFLYNKQIDHDLSTILDVNELYEKMLNNESIHWYPSEQQCDN